MGPILYQFYKKIYFKLNVMGPITVRKNIFNPYTTGPLSDRKNI